MSTTQLGTMARTFLIPAVTALVSGVSAYYGVIRAIDEVRAEVRAMQVQREGDQRMFEERCRNFADSDARLERAISALEEKVNRRRDAEPSRSIAD